jgi:hypothetical protein
MTSSPTLASVRQRHYALQSLPETITVPSLGARRPVAVVRSIDQATVDDIAFAMGGVEAEFNAVGDRLSALRKLYGLARQAGALGADGALDAAVAGLEQG